MRYKQAKADLTAKLTDHFGIGEARAMSRLIWEEVLQKRLLSGADFEPSTEQLAKLADITSRVLEGEPIQHVLGYVWFYGLRFHCDGRALIPRPETEELVRWILETHGPDQPLKVLDIGTGGGCIAITLKVKRPLWEITALDSSAFAMSLTMANSRLHDCFILPQLRDILDEAEWPQLGQWDIIVSNPPYIPRSERWLMPEQVLEFEPGGALFVPDDKPLLFYEAISRLASRQLAPNGSIFVEINEFYAAETKALFEQDGWQEVELQADMQGKMRMIRACKHC